MGKGIAQVKLIGYNPSGSTTASTVWSGGATSYVQLTTGVAMEVVSASGNDTAAGTGARTIKIEGLVGTTGFEYTPFTETITMNGATPVPLVNTNVIAVNRCFVVTAGSTLTNAGKIDVRAVSGAAVKSSIQFAPESLGISADFVYTIPASRQGVLRRVQLYSRGTTGDIWCYIKTQNSTGITFISAGGSQSLNVAGFNPGNVTIEFGDSFVINEKVCMSLVVDVSAGTPIVAAVGELELY